MELAADGVDATASSPAPDADLEALRRRGTRRDPDGRWVVADPAAVATVLTSDAAVVAPPGPPVDPVDEVRATMARFSDGAAHARRRAIAVAALAGLAPERARDRADELTAAALAGRAEVDVGDLAARVPVRVLAEAMGWEAGAIDEAVALLCARLAPRRDDPARPDPGTVLARFRDAVGTLDERTVNEVAVLFQARDATAALIAVAAPRVLDGTRRAVTVADVLAADRAEPVVHTTGRRTLADLPLGAVTIPAGSTVVVALAAATRATDDATWSFGAGRHACPGRELALAIAAGLLTALGRCGARVGQPVAYDPRPNLRLPVLPSAKLTAGRATTGGDGQ